MTLQDIFDIILIRSGEFLVPIDKIELDTKKFKILVQNALAFYSKHAPKVKNIYINASTITSRQYTFTENTSPLGIPDFISDIIPLRISGVVPYYLREFDRPKSNLDIKVEFPWTYRKPVLTIPTNAEFDVKAVYHHKLKNIGNDSSPVWICDTIGDEDVELYDLILGRFLIGLGKSRRAFTIAELPIKADAAELVTEGNIIEEQAKKDIVDDASWYLAWQ